MDEAELDEVRDRIERSMARQREEYGEDKARWPWATVRDTTVLRLLTYIWELELEVAELRADAALGYAWRTLRDAGMSPDAAATWLATPSSWLDGEVPEQADPDQLRRAVDRKVSTAAG